MSSTPPRRRGTPQIFVTGDTQVPHTAHVGGTAEPDVGGIYVSGMSRAQLKDTGPPAPAPASRTTDHFTQPASTPHTSDYEIPSHHQSHSAPASWDPHLVAFLEQLSSPHMCALESLGIWQDELARMRVPAAHDLGAQWREAAGFVEYIGRQFEANDGLTGNLHWAVFHFVAQLRALRTVDFMGDLPPALRSLQFVLHVAVRGRGGAVVARNRRPADGAADLAADKAQARELGVYARALRQTQADGRPLHEQLLHYVVLAVARLDAVAAPDFYARLAAMVIDALGPQVALAGTGGGQPALEHALLSQIGPSTAFNAASTQAADCMHALLLNALLLPPAQGLVRGAYARLFARAELEPAQISLHLLLLLAAQAEPNPFLRALAGVRDAPADAPRIGARVPFARVFGRLVDGLASAEWTALLHVLITCNGSFRTYVLARTDPDVLVVPLLRLVGQATAVPAHARAATAAGAMQRLRQGAQLPCAQTLDTVPYVHVYLWLETLLVLSGDAQFVGQLQRTEIEYWAAAPQHLHGQPLSLCVAAEMLRLVQVNITVVRDRHLHDLALGVLANVLVRSTNVSAPVAQRLLKLFEMLAKRHHRLSATKSDCAELAVCARTLAVLLAVLCRLAHTDNPQVIYALLQARQLLSTVRPGGGDMAAQTAAALRVRVAYFHARVAALSHPQPDDILELIASIVAGEPALRDAPRVDFSCVADHVRSAFMLPLVWELVLSLSSTSISGPTPLLDQFELCVL
ncbi:hypothetical protein LPJ63_003756 [Coemansia sp. RSA 2711]|nr:hypothetical protein LPJ63_003756 [Coemansia sp. RSA 2711]